MLKKAQWLCSRTVKTLHTPIYNASNLATRQSLLTYIAILEKVVHSASYSRSVLYAGKYKKLPQAISGNDTVRMNYMLKELLTSLQLSEAENPEQQRDPSRKLGKIGLQLFMACQQDNVTALGTGLTKRLVECYNRYPSQDMAASIETSLSRVREFLKQNKLIIKDRGDIDQLVNKLASSEEDASAIRKVLLELNYELVSDEVIRVVRGRRTEDEIEVSKGWKFPSGLLDSNEPYKRSLQLSKNKLVAVNSESLVLVHDGTLREADKILPSLHYASKQQKSLVIVVNGDCIGDALAAITIHNNKCRRQGVPSQAIVLRYIARDHQGVELQENIDFLSFLKLPQGVGSVYSPEFSEHVPSTASAALFFGSLESLKATTGEAFLYNTQVGGQEIRNDALRTTVTLHVGGHSEFEIDHRRAQLDHIMNNILCHGLAHGWVPSQGVALAKSVAVLQSGDSRSARSPGADVLTESLMLPLESAVTNLYAAHRFEASRLTAETIADPSFTTAYLPEKCSTVERGVVEPWSNIDKILAGVASFVKLAASCDVLVTRFFDKPKKND
ncbi:Mitochondrial chaperone TCM62 [Lachancea thermotolerans]